MAVTISEIYGGNSSTSVLFQNAISGNGGAGSDLILAIGIFSQGATGIGFSDPLDSGSYTNLLGANGYNSSQMSQNYQIAYKIVNAGTNVGGSVVSSSQNTVSGVFATATQSFVAGQAIQFSDGDTLPGGFSLGTTYYITNAGALTTTSCCLSASSGTSGAVKVPSASSGCHIGGTCRVSAAAGTGSPTRIAVMHFTGFTNTAQFAAGDLSYAQGNGTAVDSGSFNTAQANEYIINWMSSNNNITMTGGPWTSSFPWGSNGTAQLVLNYLTANPVAQNTAADATGTQLTNTWFAAVLGFYDGVPAVPTYGDGTSASNTVVTTGTNGQAMPAITSGQVLDIVLMAETGSALTDSGPVWVGTSGGSFTNIQTISSTGYIFDHWQCVVTTSVALPVIKTTWSGGTPTKAGIAVVPNNGVLISNPISAGNYNVNHQVTPTGTDGQVSGNTTNPLTTGLLYLMGSYGFSFGQASAPTAGTGFASIATMWASLGSGACLNYETRTLTGAGAVAQATFTPVGGSDSMTVMAVFNSSFVPLMGQACL